MRREFTTIPTADTTMLAVDIAGDRLTADDGSAKTEVRLDFEERITDCVRRHHGRIVNISATTCLLAEFSNALDAVDCAVKTQQELASRNRELQATLRMRIRVGVSFGDVELQDRERFEDGVESAADLANLAEPGGICISRTVYDEVKPWVNLSYDSRRDWTSFMTIPRHSLHPPKINLLKASAVKISPASITDQGGRHRRWLHLRRLLRRGSVPGAQPP